MDVTPMTYEEKVAWLKRYQDSLRIQRELELEVERLQSEATRITPLLSGMPRGQGDGQQLPRAVEAVTEAQVELQEQVLRCEEMRKEVIAAIESVSNHRDREILRRRYVLGEQFSMIAFSMNYNIRWIMRRHRCCINESLDGKYLQKNKDRDIIKLN